jgi:hypothetical protein
MESGERKARTEPPLRYFAHENFKQMQNIGSKLFESKIKSEQISYGYNCIDIPFNLWDKVRPLQLSKKLLDLLEKQNKEVD